jgi:hypothetical protein
VYRPFTRRSRRLQAPPTPEERLGLDFIDKSRPVSFRYNNGDDTLRYDFIAQDVEQALSKTLQDLLEESQPAHGLALIVRDRDKARTYNTGYTELLSPLVKSVQQLKSTGDSEQQQINKEQDDIADLKQLIAVQQKEIADLKQQIQTLAPAPLNPASGTPLIITSETLDKSKVINVICQGYK